MSDVDKNIEHSNDDSKRESMAKDEYLVAVKVLLYNDEGKILVTHDKHGDWDIPGGRIRRDQFEAPLEQILAEKIDVELGSNFEYKLGDIVTTLRLKRKEMGRDFEEVRIFGVVYEAKLTKGEVKPGPYHDQAEWIVPSPSVLKKYESKASWVTLLEEYFRSKDAV